MPANSFQVVCSVRCAIAFAKQPAGEKHRKRIECKEAREARQRIKSKAQWHAGHYRSIGAAPELRYDERNIHKQCAPCNTHKSGNAIEYRIRLIQKIGLAEVEALECEHPPRKYTVDDLIDIKRHYKDKLRALQANEKD